MILNNSDYSDSGDVHQEKPRPQRPCGVSISLNTAAVREYGREAVARYALDRESGAGGGVAGLYEL